MTELEEASTAANQRLQMSLTRPFVNNLSGQSLSIFPALERLACRVCGGTVKGVSGFWRVGRQHCKAGE